MLINANTIHELYSNYLGWLSEASGITVATELLMRILGERCCRVQSQLQLLQSNNNKSAIVLWEKILVDYPERENQKILKKYLKKLKQIKSYEYNNCELNDLVEAVYAAFDKHLLDDDSRRKLFAFRQFRNKIQHGDFVGLAKEFGVNLQGQQYLKRGRERNVVGEKNMAEAIISIAKVDIGNQIQTQAKMVQLILRKLIEECINKHNDCDVVHKAKQWDK